MLAEFPPLVAYPESRALDADATRRDVMALTFWNVNRVSPSTNIMRWKHAALKEQLRKGVVALAETKWLPAEKNGFAETLPAAVVHSTEHPCQDGSRQLRGGVALVIPNVSASSWKPLGCWCRVTS